MAVPSDWAQRKRPTSKDWLLKITGTSLRNFLPIQPQKSITNLRRPRARSQVEVERNLAPLLLFGGFSFFPDLAVAERARKGNSVGLRPRPYRRGWCWSSRVLGPPDSCSSTGSLKYAWLAGALPSFVRLHQRKGDRREAIKAGRVRAPHARILLACEVV
jgi:hypothetical protein